MCKKKTEKSDNSPIIAALVQQMMAMSEKMGAMQAKMDQLFQQVNNPNQAQAIGQRMASYPELSPYQGMIHNCAQARAEQLTGFQVTQVTGFAMPRQA